MKEIRFHGRGGQGVVIGAEILADAAIKEGKYAQSFPYFGAERRGAPVMAFTRINDKPIRLRCQIYEPDYVIVLDPAICQFQDVTSGLKPEGVVIVNSQLTPDKIKDKLIKRGKIYTIDATSIAFKIFGKAIFNTIVLGAFAAVTDEIKLQSLFEAIRDRFPEAIAEKNAQAIKEAYESVKS